MGIKDKLKQPVKLGTKNPPVKGEEGTEKKSKPQKSTIQIKPVKKNTAKSKSKSGASSNKVLGIFSQGSSKKTNQVERVHKSRMLLITVCAIIVFAGSIAVILHFFSPRGLGDAYGYLQSIMSSVLALLFAVIILDAINAHGDKQRKKREERTAIIRHNKIIQPIIDMYIVRKNMVITPNDRNVRKFQINAKFTIKDMKDMFGPSELISDVGKSKLDTYALYQDTLQEKLVHLVEDIDFSFYPEVCDSAMKYINATSYGSSAISAVVGYQNSMAGTKSMKSILLNMIRDEPDNGTFNNAPPALKNVYLLHQTINDQEDALEVYLKSIQEILSQETKEKGYSTQIEYE